MGLQHPVSRRRFLLTSGLTSTAALLAACGAPGASSTQSGPTAPVSTGPTAAPASGGQTSRPTPAAAAATGAPRRGGELLVAEQNDTQTFDPHRATGGSPAYGMVYNTLVRWDPQPDGTFKAGPDLATDWRLDGTTATFTLRQGVKFHDGSDWNADVAKFNLERMNDAKSQARAFVTGITSIEAVDASTLRLRLSAPLGSLLSNLSQSADGR